LSVYVKFSLCRRKVGMYGLCRSVTASIIVFELWRGAG